MQENCSSLPSYQSLQSISQILHLAHHRNKNQHRHSVWYKYFSQLRRQVAKLISELNTFKTAESISFGMSGKKVGVVDNKYATIARNKYEQRGEFILDILIPKGYFFHDTTLGFRRRLDHLLKRNLARNHSLVVGIKFEDLINDKADYSLVIQSNEKSTGLVNWAFQNLIADNQYAVLGLMLMGALATVNNVLQELLNSKRKKDIFNQNLDQRDFNLLNEGKDSEPDDIGEIISRQEFQAEKKMIENGTMGRNLTADKIRRLQEKQRRINKHGRKDTESHLKIRKKKRKNNDIFDNIFDKLL